MTWVKATDLDGDAIWVNMLQAHIVVLREGGGSTVLFNESEAVDVREEPEQLVREQQRWPKTREAVGFIRRADNDAVKD